MDREGQVQIGTFFVSLARRPFKRVLLFLHDVNNMEHNLKQNIHIGMEVISLIHCSKNEDFH